jgi:predicted secreted protein
MANAENGNVVTLRVLGASATVLAVGSTTNFVINGTAKEIETSAKGDSVATHIIGRRKYTASVSGFYVVDDVGQDRLRDLFDGGTQGTLQIFRGGSLSFSGTAMISDLTETYSDDEAATFDMSLVFDGDLTGFPPTS